MSDIKPLKLFANQHEFQTSAANADQYVTEANDFIAAQIAKGKPVDDNFFHALAIFLSRNNIVQSNGGPFGAVIVRYAEGVDENGVGKGKPEVIGVGANHVFPHSDPTAHAEMEAYRDAAKRTGSSDLRGAVLFTSCECCPMCLGIANGCGIARISYSNDRKQAANIAGFSDALQYEIASQPHAELMTPIGQAENKEALLEKLGENGAVVLDKDGNVYAEGNANTENDPTMTASLAAIRNAAKKAESFTLPEGCTLITREKPHLSGLIAADWSRILRDRDPENPNDPERDSKAVDPKRIIYVNDTVEQVRVTGNQILQEAAVTYAQPALPDNERAVPTEHYDRKAILRTAVEVFEKWREGTTQGAQVKY